MHTEAEVIRLPLRRVRLYRRERLDSLCDQFTFFNIPTNDLRLGV